MNKVRLIDANALKEDLKQYFTDGVLDGVSARLAFNQILHDIDNAPTVPQDCSECKRFDFPYVTINAEFTEEEKQEIIEKVRKDLLIFPDEKANERPQGEWIEFADYVARNVVNDDFSEDVDFYAEVLCRKLVKLGLVKLDGDTYKYCGADMRGGSTDDQ